MAGFRGVTTGHTGVTGMDNEMSRYTAYQGIPAFAAYRMVNTIV